MGSANSGSGGTAIPDGYAKELGEMRKVLDTAPVVGLPREEAELAELERLIEKYPERAHELLDGPR